MVSVQKGDISGQGLGEEDPRRQQELVNLVDKLGLTDSGLVQWDLLHQALVDISRSAEKNNEVLEF